MQAMIERRTTTVRGLAIATFLQGLLTLSLDRPLLGATLVVLGALALFAASSIAARTIRQERVAVPVVALRRRTSVA